MKKIRGKIPSLLAQSTGKPSIYNCNRKTICRRCKESIHSGAKCVKIPKLKSGFTSKEIFCLDCFRSILQQTAVELHELEEFLITAENA